MALTDAKWNGVDPVDVFVALVGLIERPAWHSDAACREHPELSWFPARGERQDEQRAVCEGCLVRAECAAAGMFEYDGIWGGLSGRGRRLELRGTPVPRPRKPPVVVVPARPVSAKTAYMREYRARLKAREVA